MSFFRIFPHSLVLLTFMLSAMLLGNDWCSNIEFDVTSDSWEFISPTSESVLGRGGSPLIRPVFGETALLFLHSREITVFSENTCFLVSTEDQ